MATEQKAKREPIKVTEAEAWDGMLGVCLSCGNVQDGCEPDAERYECEACEKRLVFGIEMAVIMGRVEIVKDREGSSHG